MELGKDTICFFIFILLFGIRLHNCYRHFPIEISRPFDHLRWHIEKSHSISNISLILLHGINNFAHGNGVTDCHLASSVENHRKSTKNIEETQRPKSPMSILCLS